MATVAQDPPRFLPASVVRLRTWRASALCMAWTRVLLAMVAAACGCTAFAVDDPLRAVVIEHAFARATPPGAQSGGVYFTVVNNGNVPVVLTGVSSAVAGNVELHQMSMANGIMKMRAVPRVQIGAHARLALEAGGYHVMLTGLRQSLKAGDRFPVMLTFDTLGTKAVSVVVEPLVASVPVTAPK